VNQRAIWACKICDLCCNRGVPPTPDSLPNDLATAHAMILAQRELLIVAQAKADNAEVRLRQHRGRGGRKMVCGLGICHRNPDFDLFI